MKRIPLQECNGPVQGASRQARPGAEHRGGIQGVGPAKFKPPCRAAVP